MSLSVAQVYASRTTYTKLALPPVIQDAISKVRITPMVYKPAKPFIRHKKPVVVENWRENMLVDIVRRVREREDSEYSDIFSILNKITLSNVEKLSKDAIALLNKRDDEFRLRVTTLLFDKAITESAYANVMAICAKILNSDIPEVSEDLLIHITMFPKLYNLSETNIFPDITDPEYDNKVIQWMKQKDKRRGFAKFISQLYTQNLISKEIVESCIKNVLSDLEVCAFQPKSPVTEENVVQLVEFVFEVSKIIYTEHVRNYIQNIIGLPKTTTPSLNMRSRFKLQDALDELNRKHSELNK